MPSRNTVAPAGGAHPRLSGAVEARIHAPVLLVDRHELAEEFVVDRPGAGIGIVRGLDFRPRRDVVERHVAQRDRREKRGAAGSRKLRVAHLFP